MRLFRVGVALFFLAATSMRAQEVSTTIVPVVGNVAGVPGRWLTDVEIANSGPADVDIALELPVASESAPLMFTLSPGQSQRFVDIVGQAFGMPSALSPLRITSSSRRGVTVRAHAYPMRDPAAVQPIDVYHADTWFPVRVLDGLAFTDAYRTNVGLVNLGTTTADFLLALQRVPGRNVAVQRVRVGAGAMAHVSIQSLFPMITAGTGFSVVVETSARQTYVYGSVIEGETSAARFVTPRIGAR